MATREHLIEKIKSLPEDRLEEVASFVEFLETKGRGQSELAEYGMGDYLSQLSAYEEMLAAGRINRRRDSEKSRYKPQGSFGLRMNWMWRNVMEDTKATAGAGQQRIMPDRSQYGEKDAGIWPDANSPAPYGSQCDLDYRGEAYSVAIGRRWTNTIGNGDSRCPYMVW